MHIVLTWNAEDHVRLEYHLPSVENIYSIRNTLQSCKGSEAIEYKGTLGNRVFISVCFMAFKLVQDDCERDYSINTGTSLLPWL